MSKQTSTLRELKNNVIAAAWMIGIVLVVSWLVMGIRS